METSDSAKTTNSNAPAASPAPAPTATLPGVPSSWPGAFGAYKYSKQAVSLNLGTLIVIYIIGFVVSGILEYILKTTGGLLSYLVNAVLLAAFVIVFLAGVRGQRIAVGEALSQAVSFWLKMIGLLILVGISLAVSFILLIIPFFFVLPRLALAHYYLVDKKLGVVEAYQASWDATKGHAGQVWGIIGAGIAMALLRASRLLVYPSRYIS